MGEILGEIMGKIGLGSGNERGDSGDMEGTFRMSRGDIKEDIEDVMGWGDTQGVTQGDRVTGRSHLCHGWQCHGVPAGPGMGWGVAGPPRGHWGQRGQWHRLPPASAAAAGERLPGPGGTRGQLGQGWGQGWATPCDTWSAPPPCPQCPLHLLQPPFNVPPNVPIP